MRPIFASFVLGLALAACDPSETSTPCCGDTAAGTQDTAIAACVATATPSATLGTGDTAFSAIGAETTSVSGGQGATMLVLAVQAEGLDLSDGSVATFSASVGGEVKISQVTRLFFDCTADGTGQVLGIQFPIPGSLVDADAELRVEITDPAGHTAIATAKTHVQ